MKSVFSGFIFCINKYLAHTADFKGEPLFLNHVAIASPSTGLNMRDSEYGREDRVGGERVRGRRETDSEKGKGYREGEKREGK